MTGIPRFGVCCAKENLSVARDLGYDYGEVGLAWLSSLEEEDYLSIFPLLSQDFQIEAVNGLLPGDRLKLSDESYSPSALGDYLDHALERAEKLGVKIAVFGSGAARNFVPGFPREKALEQILDFARLLSDKAKEHGMQAVMEPLNHKECSNFHTVEEGYAFAKKVGHPSFGVLADFYHMWVEEEPFSHLLEAAPLLWHCHIARPDRKPLTLEDQDLCGQVADVLKQAGYQGRISLEGIITDFPREAGENLKTLKAAFSV